MIGRSLDPPEIAFALAQAWQIGVLAEPPDQPVSWDVMQVRPRHRK